MVQIVGELSADRRERARINSAKQSRVVADHKRNGPPPVDWHTVIPRVRAILDEHERLSK